MNTSPAVDPAAHLAALKALLRIPNGVAVTLLIGLPGLDPRGTLIAVRRTTCYVQLRGDQVFRYRPEYLYPASEVQS